MKSHLNYGELLGLLWDTFEMFSRRDVGWVLAGYRGFREQRDDEIIKRMLRQGLLQQEGRGTTARFTITATGRERFIVNSPAEHWTRPWDGQWRVLTYDLPETRRRDRRILWGALRSRKLGLLQRSVWVWPHPVEPIVRQIIKAEGVPECFCVFEAGRVSLCTDAEIVLAAWDFDEIRKRQEIYLKQLTATPANAHGVKRLAQLAHLARLERDAYQHAFSLDPLLPRALWPKHYLGPSVEKQHRKFRSVVSHRRRELADH